MQQGSHIYFGTSGNVGSLGKNPDLKLINSMDQDSTSLTSATTTVHPAKNKHTAQHQSTH